MRSWRSISASAAGGASTLSSVKCALRFLRMRKVSDLTPQYSFLVTLPPSLLDDALELRGQFLDLLRADVLAREIDVFV